MYQSPDMKLWKGRVNPNPDDLLLHQIIQPLDMTHDLYTGEGTNHRALLGFACDEGVRRNFGRTGSRKAPEWIKKVSAGLAIHFDTKEQLVYDAGTVLCPGSNLEAAQRMLGEKVAHLMHQGIQPIVLGGGHETAFGHFIGLKTFIPAHETIGIINLDAHFDLRSFEQGPHSGSPFRQIAELDPDKFHYLPIGIRPESNIPSLFAYLQEHRQDYIGLLEVCGAMESVKQKIQSFCDQVDHVYLTIDMDCFPAAYAPGVSASAPSGMTPYQVIEIIKTLLASNKMISADIVEVNPDYDIDDRTVKLAAELIFHLLHG